MKIKNIFFPSVVAVMLSLCVSYNSFATETAAPVVQTSKQIKIDSSEIIWTGKKVTGEHSGNIKLKDGFLLIDDAGNIVGGEFVVDMTTLTNTDLLDAEYNKKLTDHLKSEDFFSITQFNTATLKIVSVIKKTPGIYDVAADLSIKGITKPVRFDGNLTENSGVVTLDAKISIDRTQYNIRYGSGKFFQGLGDKLIHDTFDLNVKITAKR